MATAPEHVEELSDGERLRRLALVEAEWDEADWDQAIPLEDALRMIREGTVPAE